LCGAHDVAVRADRAKLVAVDDEAHGGESNRALAGLSGRDRD
jgi:hypothetical protein